MGREEWRTPIRRSQRGFDRPTPARVVLGVGWGDLQLERGEILCHANSWDWRERRESERPENHRRASLCVLKMALIQKMATAD